MNINNLMLKSAAAIAAAVPTPMIKIIRLFLKKTVHASSAGMLRTD